MKRLFRTSALATPLIVLLAVACGKGGDEGSSGDGDGDGDGGPGDGDSGDGDGGIIGDGDAGNGNGFWEMGGSGGEGASGEPNEYSWDGSWTPSSFPIDGIFDETHAQLPPGKWGWDNDCNCPGDEGLAIYENEFVGKGLDFEALEDSEGNVFGWRLVDTDGGTTELNHRGDNFEGSPGADIFDLGNDGELQGTGPNDESPGINLGDGPDMLRYGTGWSVDMRTGDSERGSAQDNDLVILGTENVLGVGEFDINGTTIHTGPGSDLVFARNFGPAAIDLGNGASGRTDTLDRSDGPDMAILEGNMRDFRVYGGDGNDVFVWYVDEVREDTWLGPNFFGGGGWGEALWAENGVDRLILVIDPESSIHTTRGSHDDAEGAVLSFVYSPYESTIDEPTEDDMFARYYGVVPEGPDGQHTVTLSYRSPDSSVFTHDFYITSVEEIQFGLGEDAVVYDVDQVTGELTESSSPALEQVPSRSVYNDLFDTFAR